MPSRDDFEAARQVAFACANASVWLLNIARNPVPAARKEVSLVRWLDQLARALTGAGDAISKVERELIRMALATGPVKAGKMECSSAHRLAVDFANYLGEKIRDIDRQLVPRGLRPIWPTPRVLGVDAELVRKHLPAIVALLAAQPPFDVQHVVALIDQESERAIERLESAGPVPPPPSRDQAAGAAAKSKRARRPRRISKVQRAIVILKYRAMKERESIRVEDIAREAECSAQNLYKSPEFMKELRAARARRIRRGWKVEGVADRPDD
jgi:hypothetical protein